MREGREFFNGKKMSPRLTKASLFTLLALLLFCGFAFGLTVNYRSIGTDTGILYDTGTASISSGSTIVTFTDGASLPEPTAVGAVGPGDELVVGGETFYILTRESDTQVTVQKAATGDRSGAYTIKRAYNTLQAWEDDRDGNLVFDDRAEVGVCYKDDTFTSTTNPILYIKDSQADSTHYMELTVAEGQRHTGSPGTGVVIDGENAGRKGIWIQSGQVARIKWLELKNFSGANYANAVYISGSTGSTVLAYGLLIHDFKDGTPGDINKVYGIKLGASGNCTLTVRNCIIYNGDYAAITGDETTDTVTIDNCTVYGIEGYGIHVESSLSVIRNTISVENNASGGSYSDFNTNASTTQEYNISSDDTASGTGCMPGRTATDNSSPGSGDWVVFNNITSGYDFHLKISSENDAIEAGEVLSFTDDIDGETRTDPWDIGADELTHSTVVDLISFTATGQSASVLIEWATATELDNAGFNIWRREDDNGEYARINPYFIPSQGEAGFGAEYSFTDYDVQNGKIYYYKLEDIDIYGRSTFHGPVPAIPHDIIIIWPDEEKILPSGALLFSWASSSNYSFKVEISLSPSFPASETICFPGDGGISGNSLWLAPREWEMVLRKAQQSGGQLFWRVSAKSREGREILSDWKKFIIEFNK